MCITTSSKSASPRSRSSILIVVPPFPSNSNLKWSLPPALRSGFEKYTGDVTATPSTSKIGNSPLLSNVILESFEISSAPLAIIKKQ